MNNKTLFISLGVAMLIINVTLIAIGERGFQYYLAIFAGLTLIYSGYNKKNS